MASTISQKLKDGFSWALSKVSGQEYEPGPSSYSASEKELIQQHLRSGNAKARAAARARGYALHPKLAEKNR